MTYSKRQLEALGEPLGNSATYRRPGDGRIVCGGGGEGGKTESDSSTKSTNTDQRVAVQDGIGLSGSSDNVVHYNSSDAVKAIAQMGADTISRTGEAVVMLNRDSQAANLTAWDKTVTAGASLVDKLIDRSTTVAEKAINGYMPSQNKEAEATSSTIKSVALVVAAAAAAAVIAKAMGGSK